MEQIELSSLPQGALLLIDTAPIIYILEGHPRLAARFRPLFDAHANGKVRFAVTTVTMAEVLTGPLSSGEEALARRYRAILDSWQVIPLDVDIAESAARLRAAYGLKLADAVQAASALAINATALVTHDHDFMRLRSLNVIS
jgi:predicted nucleic acid-binding protein